MVLVKAWHGLYGDVEDAIRDAKAMVEKMGVELVEQD